MARKSSLALGGVLLLALALWLWPKPVARDTLERVPDSANTPVPGATTQPAAVRGAPPAPRQGRAAIAWGAGLGALGRSAANESSPEAPMAVALGPRGE